MIEVPCKQDFLASRHLYEPDIVDWKREKCHVGKSIRDGLAIEKLLVFHVPGCADTLIPETVDWHAPKDIDEKLYWWR